tara:strand:- start:291 stop:749 length:459 start_codon:yes stop_codon:yes gene_type:complete
MASSLGFMSLNESQHKPGSKHLNTKLNENLQDKMTSRKAQELIDKLHSSPDDSSNLGDFNTSLAPRTQSTHEHSSDQGEYVNQYTTDTIPHTPDKNIETELMSKLNYMIHLLEETSDEKMNSVTEEMVLYCFLGVFIIFMIDSFTKIGKYVR